MGVFKEMMVEAEDALRAVRDFVQALPELEDEGGYVDELLSTGDGFLISYDTDLGPFLFLYDGNISRIERDEYDLTKASAFEMTESVPELMELVNASH